MQRRELRAPCGLSVSVEIRDVFHLLYYIRPATARTSSSAGFLDVFSFDENNGMQKELRRRGRQMQDWSLLPSNCLVIGERFPLSHYLTFRRGRQMWLSGHQPSPGRMCRGTGRSFPARRPVICFTPVLIFPHDR